MPDQVGTDVITSPRMTARREEMPDQVGHDVITSPGMTARVRPQFEDKGKAATYR